MRISNFQMVGVSKGGFEMRHATVDVTTGFLWWKKVEKKNIHAIGTYWLWTDTGAFTPDHTVKRLAEASEAQERLAKLKKSSPTSGSCSRI